jgi:hypothetical protein
MNSLNYKNNAVYSGIYCNVIFNTRGKQFPAYLSSFIDQLTLDTGGLFDAVCIHELEHHELIEERLLTQAYIKKDDNVYQLTFRICDELSYADCIEYAEGIIKNDLQPFVWGCKFYMTEPLYYSGITENHRGLARVGSGTEALYLICRKPVDEDMYEHLSILLDADVGKLVKVAKDGETIAIGSVITEKNRTLVLNVLQVNNIEYKLLKE